MWKCVVPLALVVALLFVFAATAQEKSVEKSEFTELNLLDNKLDDDGNLSKVTVRFNKNQCIGYFSQKKSYDRMGKDPLIVDGTLLIYPGGTYFVEGQVPW